MAKKAYYVTYNMLVKHNACTSQRELFLRTFIGATTTPWDISTKQKHEKVFVTRQNVKKAADAGLNFSWLFDRADMKRHPRSFNSPLSDDFWRFRWKQRRAPSITAILKKHGYLT